MKRQNPMTTNEFREGGLITLCPMGMFFDEAMRRAGATVIPTGVGNTELQVQIMHHRKATGFCGTYLLYDYYQEG